MDGTNWKRRDLATPTFYGAKHTIWGLTAYLLERFVVDVLGGAVSTAPLLALIGT